MGVVFEAEQESLGRHVALKVFPRQSARDAKSAKRFESEARAAARLHHTNIVPVFDVGSDDQYMFYAMQLIQGQALDLVIDDLKQLRDRRADVSEPNHDAAPNEDGIAKSLVRGRFEQQPWSSGTDASHPNQENESQRPEKQGNRRHGSRLHFFGGFAWPVCDLHCRRQSAGLLSERGKDRCADGSGAFLRPCPRHHSPRH